MGPSRSTDQLGGDPNVRLVTSRRVRAGQVVFVTSYYGLRNHTEPPSGKVDARTARTSSNHFSEAAGAGGDPTSRPGRDRGSPNTTQGAVLQPFPVLVHPIGFGFSISKEWVLT
jgi:hypothetical protein